MKFGRVPVKKARGAVLAHATSAGETRFRKAHRLGDDDVAALLDAGVGEVIAAVLEPGDIGEDDAATMIARSFDSKNVERNPASTGRVNFHARAAGVFIVDRALIDSLNAVDPAITVATLAEHTAVVAGQMVATVKIIPFAVSRESVEAAVALARARSAFLVQGFVSRKVGLIQTLLPGIKTGVLDKTARVTAARLERSGSSIQAEDRVGHEPGAVSAVLNRHIVESDIVLIFGASAMCDENDVIPAAIRESGGEVLRCGMPVDPGNLLVLGRLAGKPVIGAPGCARSPKTNGFDWVLDRLVSGIDVTSGDVAKMGVGGLLMEIPSRPRPREDRVAAEGVRVAAVLLAAGRSSRMGGNNKLLADFDGEPLVRRVGSRLAASRCLATTAVVGHQASRIAAALGDLDVRIVENPDYPDGLATSLRCGMAAMPPQVDGAMIVLADMPDIRREDFDALIAAFESSGGRAIVRAAHGTQRGNPVILPRALFGAASSLEGDTGARQIIERSGLEIIDVEIGRAAAVDVDTPDAMSAAGGVLVD